MWYGYLCISHTLFDSIGTLSSHLRGGSLREGAAQNSANPHGVAKTHQPGLAESQGCEDSPKAFAIGFEKREHQITGVSPSGDSPANWRETDLTVKLSFLSSWQKNGVPRSWTFVSFKEFTNSRGKPKNMEKPSEYKMLSVASRLLETWLFDALE